jgi:hypothetical protein
VCRRSYTIPTRRKSAPVEMPWLIIWRTAPWIPAMFKAKMPSITNPRCETEEYAISRFMSFWTSVTIAPYTIPTIASTIMRRRTHGVCTASGNIGSEKRTKP